MSLAWHSAAFQRAKKMPRLSELTGVKSKSKPRIDEAEIVGALMAYQKKREQRKE